MSAFKVPDSEWFDFWHYHVDWLGLSRESLRAKIQHEEALMILLDTIKKQMVGRGIPYQVWGQISDESESNAVYIHTPNPHAEKHPYSVFPYDFKDTTWGMQVGAYQYGIMKWGKHTITIIKA
jgi:hypothetical protein